MNLRVTLARLAGSLAHWGTVNLAHRGGGNIPGAVALRVDPGVVGELSAGLEPRIVVTGTNGKTTTTGLIADALASGGSAVVCNRAGNNMESGIAAALVLAGPDRKGEQRIGCFECDELYTVRVLPAMRPRALVLLNLFRDQLDRYGEIDHTQDVIAKALQGSPETAIIFDADDPLCAAIADRVDNPGVPFGIDEPTGIEADRISDSRFCAPSPRASRRTASRTAASARTATRRLTTSTSTTDSWASTAAPSAAGRVPSSHLPQLTCAWAKRALSLTSRIAGAGRQCASTCAPAGTVCTWSTTSPLRLLRS